MTFNFKPTDISLLMKDVITIIDPQAKKKDIVLNFSNNVPYLNLVLDDKRIEQVFINILSNAIKFSPAASRINIEVNIDKLYAVFSFKDKGPGVPVDQLDKIFIPFIQSDFHKNNHKSGTGLGLAISKEIINAHNGSIYCENNNDGGSTFIVLLPLK